MVRRSQPRSCAGGCTQALTTRARVNATRRLTDSWTKISRHAPLLPAYALREVRQARRCTSSSTTRLRARRHFLRSRSLQRSPRQLRRERTRGEDRAPFRGPVRTQRGLRPWAREAHHEPERSAVRGGRNSDVWGPLCGRGAGPARRAWMALAVGSAGTPRGDWGSRDRGCVFAVLCGDSPRRRDRSGAVSSERTRLFARALVACPRAPADSPARSRHGNAAVWNCTCGGHRGLSRLGRGVAPARDAALLAAFPPHRAARAARHSPSRAHGRALHLGRGAARAVLAFVAG